MARIDEVRHLLDHSPEKIPGLMVNHEININIISIVDAYNLMDYAPELLDRYLRKSIENTIDPNGGPSHFRCDTAVDRIILQPDIDRKKQIISSLLSVAMDLGSFDKHGLYEFWLWRIVLHYITSTDKSLSNMLLGLIQGQMDMYALDAQGTAREAIDRTLLRHHLEYIAFLSGGVWAQQSKDDYPQRSEKMVQLLLLYLSHYPEMDTPGKHYGVLDGGEQRWRDGLFEAGMGYLCEKNAANYISIDILLRAGVRWKYVLDKPNVVDIEELKRHHVVKRYLLGKLAQAHGPKPDPKTEL